MQNEFGKLQWRCRRGLLELDLLLNQFLKRCYPLLDRDARQAFSSLVALDDPALWQLINQPAGPAETADERVLTILRNIANHADSH